MPIRVQCPGCKTALAVKDHLAGKRVKCPKCQSPMAVPGPTAAGAMPVSPKASTAKPAVKPPVTSPIQSTAKPPVKAPVKTPKVPVAPAAPAPDMEAEAAAALRDEPAAPNGTNGNGHVNGNATAAAKPPIKFNCEYCEAEIEIEADLSGKKAQCPECRRIIKVPLMKEEKAPGDWRKTEKKGPALAAVNQLEKVENAWGTERRAQVSQAALLEAGVIEKPRGPAVGVGAWIGRVIKAAVIVLVAGGLGVGIWNLQRASAAKRELDKLAAALDKKWPPIVQAEFHVVLADVALSKPKLREDAREHFILARQKAAQSTKPDDKVDGELFLIRLAQEQLKLGGEEMEIRDLSRFDWNQEVYVEVERTVGRIETPEARICALRHLVPAFADHKQTELGHGLVGRIVQTTPPAKAFRVALLFGDLDKEADAKNLAPPPQAGKKIDLIARCGYAEGYARRAARAREGNSARTEADVKKAFEIADMPGETGHRVQALVAVAESLALDPKGDKGESVKAACDAVCKHLDKDAKAAVPPWVLLQHVRLTARGDCDKAREFAKKLPLPYQRRAHLEIALVELAKPEATAVHIEQLDREGPGRGLAWIHFAKARAKANQSFHFNPDPDDEALRPFFKAFDALAATR